MVPVRHDAPVQCAVFSSRADSHDFQFFAAQLHFKQMVGFPGVQAPQRLGVADFNGVPIYPEINRFSGFAADDQALNAAGTQGGAKTAANIRASQNPGQRGTGIDMQPG